MSKSAFVDFATAPIFPHPTPSCPVKPALATAALFHVYERIERSKHTDAVDHVATDEGLVVSLLQNSLGLVNGEENDGSLASVPVSIPHNGASSSYKAVLLHRRYLVELQAKSVLSREGLTCWVIVASDTAKHSRSVAIKIYKKKFRAILTQETDMNRRLKGNDPCNWANLLNVYDSFQFGHGDERFHCVVMELLDPKPLFAHAMFANLGWKTDENLSYTQRSTIMSATLDDIRRVAFELVKTLGYLKWQRVIHSDLKPENILVSANGPAIDSVRLIDFGNAISDAEEDRALYFDKFQIQPRLYRAPEVYFGMTDFSFPIDIWSLGCIVAELFLGEPIFPSEDEGDILSRIFEVLGPFPRALFFEGRRFHEWRGLVSAPPYDAIEKRRRLMEKLDTVDACFVHFVAGCLEYDPLLRLTPFDAASHSFLAPLCPLKYLLPPRPLDPRQTWCASYGRQMRQLAGFENDDRNGHRRRTEEEVFMSAQTSKRRLRNLAGRPLAGAPPEDPITSALPRLSCQRIRVQSMTGSRTEELIEIEDDVDDDANVFVMDSPSRLSDSSLFKLEGEKDLSPVAPTSPVSLESPIPPIAACTPQTASFSASSRISASSPQSPPTPRTPSTPSFLDLIVKSEDSLSEEYPSRGGKEINHKEQNHPSLLTTLPRNDIKTAVVHPLRPQLICSPASHTNFSQTNDHVNDPYDSTNGVNDTVDTGLPVGVDVSSSQIENQPNEQEVGVVSIDNNNNPITTSKRREKTKTLGRRRRREKRDKKAPSHDEKQSRVEPNLGSAAVSQYSGKHGKKSRGDSSRTDSSRLLKAKRRKFQSSATSSKAISSKTECKLATPLDGRVKSDRAALLMHLENLVYHKHSPIFARPIRTRDAPEYDLKVFRPMDISTIRTNVKTGILTTFQEMKRDILLMFTNATMYNAKDEVIFCHAQEMLRHVNALMCKAEFELSLAAGKVSGIVSQVAKPSKKRRRSSTKTKNDPGESASPPKKKRAR